MDNPERIWLVPDMGDGEGRRWCDTNPGCDGDPAVMYVRSDLAPPRDVDAESVLGKLYAIQDAGPCTVTDAKAETGIYVNVRRLIAVIEGLQRERDETRSIITDVFSYETDHEGTELDAIGHSLALEEPTRQRIIGILKAESLASKGKPNE